MTAVIYRKIGVDFHGVINSNPQFFRRLFALFLEHGHRVYIVSGGPREYIKQYLQENDIPYSKIWCIYDHFEARNKVTFLPDGGFYVDDLLWDSAKGKYCRRAHISLQIDDSKIYGRYFTTPYIYYDTATQSFNLNNKQFSTADDVAEIYRQLCVFL